MVISLLQLTLLVSVWPSMTMPFLAGGGLSRLSSAASACSTQWTVEILTADCISSKHASISTAQWQLCKSLQSLALKTTKTFILWCKCVWYICMCMHMCAGAYAHVKRPEEDVGCPALSLSHSTEARARLPASKLQ